MSFWLVYLILSLGTFIGAMMHAATEERYTFFEVVAVSLVIVIMWPLLSLYMLYLQIRVFLNERSWP